MSNRLILTDRSFKGFFDGPEEIADSLLEYSDLSESVVLFGGKIYDWDGFLSVSRVCFPIFKYAFINDIALMKQIFSKERPSEILMFNYLNMPLLSILLAKLFRIKVKIIGYDSFSRMYHLLYKSTNKLSHLARWYYYGLLEFYGSILGCQFFLVSLDCMRQGHFFNKFRTTSLLPLKPRVSKFEESVWKPAREVIVCGRFISEWMVADFRRKVHLIEYLSKEGYSIIVQGRGAEEIVRKYGLNRYSNISSIDWLDDFDSFYRGRHAVVIYNQEFGSGVQTKAQKILAFGNCLIMNRTLSAGSFDGVENLIQYGDISEIHHLISAITENQYHPVSVAYEDEEIKVYEQF